MIILNNFLYSCEPCLANKCGQTCEHPYVKGLLSVEKTSVRITKTRGLQGIEGVGNVDGQYRLIIEKIPNIRKIYTFDKNGDQEILFHKGSNVDITAKIGKYAYDLDPFTTRVKICSNKEYLDGNSVIPYGQANCVSNNLKSSVESKAFGQLYTDPSRVNNDKFPSTSELENYSYFNSKGVSDEPIIMRPLSRRAKIRIKALGNSLRYNQNDNQNDWIDNLDNTINHLLQKQFEDEERKQKQVENEEEEEQLRIEMSYASSAQGQSLKERSVIELEEDEDDGDGLYKVENKIKSGNESGDLDSEELKNKIVQNLKDINSSSNNPHHLNSPSYKVVGSPIRYTEESMNLSGIASVANLKRSSRAPSVPAPSFSNGDHNNNKVEDLELYLQELSVSMQKH
ncbi:hypothetical protein BN7_1671 [Wickerhamomyces ciferrii]|uniref:Copper-fist domain-containing protein n=1 Tax=Wickerhamomyces ciferrii (strain ATCC 14091 / BCRC 22168 / CBS 111 / JCM 3599 / NBRC 0793 / NRRL Y-1031 F-60-10) TaxID=1206466 RepID=K0KJ05_WICCF|nr:uncharacterized protein BN7_1671 [Wickerhamomyces ciferrii]CCH42127.1 hypothetical protein BN7_1671 [Wickerhamomyces ciferrii]